MTKTEVRTTVWRLDSITSMELEIPMGAKHGYLECAAERCKTATTLEKRTRLLPVVIPQRASRVTAGSNVGWRFVNKRNWWLGKGCRYFQTLQQEEDGPRCRSLVKSQETG